LKSVVQDLAILIAKGEVGRGLEGGHNDGLQDIVDGEGIQVAQSLAGLIHLSNVGVNGALGVAVPFHHASDLASEEDSLHTLVMKRESGKKGFPDLLRAQKLGRAVGVEDSDGFSA
jgi:hypothetical protein